MPPCKAIKGEHPAIAIMDPDAHQDCHVPIDAAGKQHMEAY